MIRITPEIAIEERELEEQFELASGPGGQHVNKAATAVRLVFDVVHSPSLPEDVRARLVARIGGRLDAAGKLTLVSQRFRSQQRNREDVRMRLAAMIREAVTPPKPRKPTKPSKAAQKKRIEQKKQRSQIKAARGKVKADE